MLFSSLSVCFPQEKKRSQPATLKNIAAKRPLLCRPRWLSVTERGEFSQQLICSPPCFCQEVQAGQVQTSECLRASISTTTTTREFEQANTNSSGNYFCHRFTSARRTERIVGWESCFRFCLKLDVRHNVPSFDLRCTYFGWETDSSQNRSDEIPAKTRQIVCKTPSRAIPYDIDKDSRWCRRKYHHHLQCRYRHPHHSPINRESRQFEDSLVTTLLQMFEHCLFFASGRLDVMWISMRKHIDAPPLALSMCQLCHLSVKLFEQSVVGDKADGGCQKIEIL